MSVINLLEIPFLKPVGQCREKFLRIKTATSKIDRFVVQISSEDLYVPLRKLAAQNFSQQDGERVSFFPRRTSCGPGAKCAPVGAATFDHVRHYEIFQEVECFAVAEETGDVD